jgi:hypothetical protein
MAGDRQRQALAEVFAIAGISLAVEISLFQYVRLSDATTFSPRLVHPLPNPSSSDLVDINLNIRILLGSSCGPAAGWMRLGCISVHSRCW